MYKNFGVRFYVGSFVVAGQLGVGELLGQLHSSHAAGTHYPQLPDGSVAYEMRDLKSLNNGKVFKGILAVLRDDAPNIRQADGAERPITLGTDEHVIEKNHFLYFSDRQLMVWQVNGRGSHISRMEKYLTSVAGATVVLGDVLMPAALAKLNSGIIRKFKLRVASGRNAEAVDPHNWEASTFDLMRGAGATSITVEVASRQGNPGLTDSVKQAVHRMLDRDDTRALQVTLEGDREPIDLFADCLRATISVKMVGLYPVTIDLFAALELAKTGKQAELDEYFGQGTAVLV